jgi:hypothetical protein
LGSARLSWVIDVLRRRLPVTYGPDRQQPRLALLTLLGMRKLARWCGIVRTGAWDASSSPQVLSRQKGRKVACGSCQVLSLKCQCLLFSHCPLSVSSPSHIYGLRSWANDQIPTSIRQAHCFYTPPPLGPPPQPSYSHVPDKEAVSRDSKSLTQGHTAGTCRDPLSTL